MLSGGIGPFGPMAIDMSVPVQPDSTTPTPATTSGPHLTIFVATGDLLPAVFGIEAGPILPGWSEEIVKV
ncbi:MAG: hypothetical protein CMP81_13675 [Fulvimarina sp.]|nr:hypothetical protein [Fulvimarina sp.]